MTAAPLSAPALRVLGALAEKEATTPDNYPLTLNALTAACNQASNRDPVMQLSEGEVAGAIDELTRHSLVRAVHRGDARVRRYRHLLSDTLNLHQPEIAALTVLLLRGPQTAGEIRTRTARLFEFIDIAHVEITLQSLSTLSTPLVAQLPRAPGQKEVRYVHLLGGEAAGAPGGGPGTASGVVSGDAVGSASVGTSGDASADATGDVSGAATAGGGTPGDATASTAGRGREPAAAAAASTDGARIDALERELAAVRAELARLGDAFEAFRREFQ